MGEEIDAARVVVSAGTIHSPAILIRSGVGGNDRLAVGAKLKAWPLDGAKWRCARPVANGPTTQR